MIKGEIKITAKRIRRGKIRLGKRIRSERLRREKTPRKMKKRIKIRIGIRRNAKIRKITKRIRREEEK